MYEESASGEVTDKVFTMLDRIYDELKTVPVTMMLVCALYISIAWLYWDHVPAREFYALESQLIGVQDTLKRDHLDTRIHAIESEEFTLNQHVEDAKKKGLDVDPLYYQRLDDLKNQSEEIKVEIHALDRADMGRIR